MLFEQYGAQTRHLIFLSTVSIIVFPKNAWLRRNPCLEIFFSPRNHQIGHISRSGPLNHFLMPFLSSRAQNGPLGEFLTNLDPGNPFKICDFLAKKSNLAVTRAVGL